ncbi:MAG: cob(I)yrinic acid a,c-diamide adenosyltransferase [Betaproteobacteria bacterium]|nr:cob(I)yrinic acid a,c-diamide adenosyltransferase [Betaproteobacteria bacterium]
MGHRLSKITTRTGDSGETGLGDGSRVPKDHARIHALGEIDELNSFLGLLLADELPEPMRDALGQIQHDLFDLGGEISIPGHTLLAERRLEQLELLSEAWNAELGPLKEFILPGGARSAALAHIARTVCRRAERALVVLARDQGATPIALKYVNRLSDLLFILARALNRHAGRSDVLWHNPKQR